MSTISLSIVVSDIDSTLLDFSTIRVFKSISGELGELIELTGNSPAPAELLAIDGNYAVAGLTLSLKIDLAEQVDVLFTGTTVLTPAQVADQINTALSAAVASDTGTALLLTSTTTGTGSKVEIVGGSAAALFGWAAEDYSGGVEANIPLAAGISNYSFLDKDGEIDHLYKVQYYNVATGLTSSLSDFFAGGENTLISPEALSLAKVDLVDGRGVAVSGQIIIFYPQQEPLLIEGYQVALNKEALSMETDNAGHAELSLVRGLKVRVVFEGTSTIREIVVPDAAEFNLLEQMSTGYDSFSITTLPFNAAPRRTL